MVVTRVTLMDMVLRRGGKMCLISKEGRLDMSREYIYIWEMVIRIENSNIGYQSSKTCAAHFVVINYNSNLEILSHAPCPFIVQSICLISVEVITNEITLVITLLHCILPITIINSKLQTT